MPIHGAEFDENGKKIRYKGLGYFRKDKQTYCIQDGKIFRCVSIPPKNQGRHEYIELDSEEIEALNLNVERPPKQKIKKKKQTNTSESPTQDKENEDNVDSQNNIPQTKKRRPPKIHDPNQEHTIQGSKFDENGKKIRYKGLGYFRKDKQTYCIQDSKIFRCIPIPPKNQGRHEYIELDSEEIEALDLNGTGAKSEVPEKDSKDTIISNQNDEDANTQDEGKGNTRLPQAQLNEHSKPKSYAEVVESHRDS